MVIADKKTKTVAITGYVDPMDEVNHQAGIFITTEAGEAYEVVPNKQGRRLMDLIGEKVTAQGTLTQTEEGETRISVTKFETHEYEETWYDEESDYHPRSGLAS